jgi:hypothetical protein
MWSEKARSWFSRTTSTVSKCPWARQRALLLSTRGPYQISLLQKKGEVADNVPPGTSVLPFRDGLRCMAIITLGTSDINYFSVEHSRRGYDSTGLSSVGYYRNQWPYTYRNQWPYIPSYNGILFPDILSRGHTLQGTFSPGDILPWYTSPSIKIATLDLKFVSCQC